MLPAAGLGQAGLVGFFLRHSQQNMFPGPLTHAGGFLDHHALVWYPGTCAFWVRPFHVMGNTTGWEKPQSTKSYRGPSNLFMSPVSTGKKMSSVETRVIKRSSGGCEHQGPSAMVQGPQRGKPPDTWDKLQDREQRAFTCLNWDTFPKVNLKWMIQQCSGRPMFPLLLRELGWNRTRCSGKL